MLTEAPYIHDAENHEGDYLDCSLNMCGFIASIAVQCAALDNLLIEHQAEKNEKDKHKIAHKHVMEFAKNYPDEAGEMFKKEFDLVMKGEVQ